MEKLRRKCLVILISPSSLSQDSLQGLAWGVGFKPSLSTTLMLATFTQFPPPIIREHSLSLIRHLVWEMFSFWEDSSYFGTCPSMLLTTNKSSSLGLISSSLEDDEEEVWEEELFR